MLIQHNICIAGSGARWLTSYPWSTAAVPSFTVSNWWAGRHLSCSVKLRSHIQIEGEKRKSDKALAGLLVSYSFLFSAVYLTFPYPIIHQVGQRLEYYNDDFHDDWLQVLYGIMIVVMIYLGLLPILKTKDPVNIKLFSSCVIIFLLAFILWNIGKYYISDSLTICVILYFLFLDNQFCSSLQQFRERSPSYISPLSQLHGWWHILTGSSVCS